MKRIYLTLTALVMTITLAVFASCSSDDESAPGKLPQQPYESISAKFTVEDPSSKYESIELTEGGKYIIMLKNAAYNAKADDGAKQQKRQLTRSHKASTRAYGNIIYGNYTRTADNSYSLEGFGEMHISYSGDQATGIVIKTPQAQENVRVRKESFVSNGGLTSALCRTWIVDKIHYTITDKVSGEHMSETLIPDNSNDPETPKNIIITRSGTYFVINADGSTDAARWRWKDISNGIIEYTWDDRWDGFTCSLNFIGDRLEAIEQGEDDYETWKYYYYLRAEQTTPGQPDDNPDTNPDDSVVIDPLPDVSRTPLLNVFHGKIVKKIDDYSMAYEQNLLLTMSDDEEIIHFKYNYLTTGDKPDVYVNLNTNRYTIEFLVSLNSMGFAEHVKEIYTDNYGKTYSDYYFDYDNEGHLISANNEEDKYTLTWENGNIVKTTKTSGDGETHYTLFETQEGLYVNRNCLTLYYDVYDVDLDELECLYWAGLLGRSTKDLPSAAIPDDEQKRTLTWHEDRVEIVDASHKTVINYSFYDSI